MNNHYHLLLETPEGNLSQIMRHINGAYTTYYNVKRKRSGHLFQGRYHAVLLEVDAHAKELSRYIHLNPVRAGMVEKPEDYLWSSYRVFINEAGSPKWLRRDFILGYFDNNIKAACHAYRTFVAEMPAKAYESPLKHAIGNILGKRDFIEKITATHLAGKEIDRNVPEIRTLKSRPSAEEIIRKASEALPDNKKPARQVGIYLCHRYSGSSLRELGEHFKIGESAISEASRRFGIRLDKDSSLQLVVEELRRKLNV